MFPPTDPPLRAWCHSHPCPRPQPTLRTGSRTQPAPRFCPCPWCSPSPLSSLALTLEARHLPRGWGARPEQPTTSTRSPQTFVLLECPPETGSGSAGGALDGWGVFARCVPSSGLEPDSRGRSPSGAGRGEQRAVPWVGVQGGAWSLGSPVRAQHPSIPTQRRFTQAVCSGRWRLSSSWLRVPPSSSQTPHHHPPFDFVPRGL